MRSLFVRVFVTFWLASALMIVSLIIIPDLTSARPLSHRWLMHSLDLYARTSISAYEQGGVASLDEYLSAIRSDSQISATLLKDDVNLTGLSIPPARELLARAEEEKQSQFSFGLPWLGVVRQARGEHVYFFVCQVHPVRMLGNFVDPEKGLFRLALALLISGSVCGLLARSISKPIHRLQRTRWL